MRRLCRRRGHPRDVVTRGYGPRMGEDVLEGAGTQRRYEHDQVVVRQGEESSTLWFIRAGAVRLSAVTESGREVVVALLGPGDLFGESALLPGRRSSVEARAVGPTEVLALPEGAIAGIVRHSPRTAEELLRMIATRLHRTATALEDALAHDVPTRVSLRLRDLARAHGSTTEAGVRLPPRLTQEELGRMVGATRESVNRSLAVLAARGLLRIEGRCYVLPDPEALSSISPT